jgi:hypothetical protein
VPPWHARPGAWRECAMSSSRSPVCCALPEASDKAVRSAAALCLGLTLLVAPALGQQGLNVTLPEGSPGMTRPALSAAAPLGAGDLRLELSMLRLGLAQPRTRLFGDYYLTGPGFGDGQLSGGLRLTSGLTLGATADTSALPPPRLLPGHDGRLRHGSSFSTGLPDRDGQRVALPYIGLGYTTLSAREGWGLSADIGLGGLRPGDRVRLGLGGANAAQVENILNNLRLSPVLQLGVSYSF